MNLDLFMQRTGISATQVAEEIGVNVSTISRIRRGLEDPTGRVLLKLNRWAKREARRQKLARGERLTWGHLLE